MPIETGTTISQLDESWPLGTDPGSSGDNHLRLIKAVLKLQFPGEAGDGFAAVIDATEAEMNYLVGVTSNIQDQIDAIYAGINAMFPVGHHLFTVKTDNPATYGYPGTWVLLESDVSIHTGNVGNAGTTLGNNNVAVPLVKHSHSIQHTHSRGTMEIIGSFLSDNDGQSSGSTGAFYDGGHVGGFGDDGGGDSRRVQFAGSRNWTGVTSNPSSANSGDSGTADVTMDVRGKRKNLLCWERTE